MEAVLEGVQSQRGRYEFGGYIVGPDRTDERVTVEKLTVYGHTDRGEAGREAVLGEVRDTFGGRPPDEVRLVDVPWRPGEKAWDLWWD